MPAVSRKQQRFMAMCANNPKAANGKCPPKEVAKDFIHLSPVKTRARKKGPPVRPGHPEDDKRYVRYY